MPKEYRTCPWKLEPMTGSSLGYCANLSLLYYNIKGYGKCIGARSFGRVRGFDFGYSRGISGVSLFNYIDVDRQSIIDNKIRSLKNKISYLENQLYKSKN